MVHTRPAALAVLLGSLASVGCMNTEPLKEPLALGSDARNRLTAPADPTSPKANKVPAFDPKASTGTGLARDNSGNRTGDFASRLPPPEIGMPPAVSAPTREGVSYGEPMQDQGRTSMTRAAPPAPPARPVEPIPLSPPKLDPPVSEPPVRPVAFKDPEPPAAPSAIRPVQPPSEVGPLPAPVAPSGPLPPVAPTLPGVAPNEPLPAAPAPPSFHHTPAVLPPSGVVDAPKLPPPPPIRPQ